MIAGAFAAHGLQGRLPADMLAVFDTAARYHLMQALALGLVAVVLRDAPRARISAWLFLAGIVLFCGSLYGLALTGVRGFGFVTPFGGLAFIGGWLALAWAALRYRA